MSSKNNVNKDFYTLAGRDRPNELVMGAPAPHRPDDMPGRSGGARPNFIPGAAPVGESPAPDERAAEPGDRAAEPDGREAQTSAEKTGTHSGSQQQATARRDGKAPGKARPKSGAFGDAGRQPQDSVSGKRGTTRAEATRRSRRRAA